MINKIRHVRGRSVHSIESGSGPPLLLLPSATGRAAEYREIVPILARKFQVYAIDYPGFGQSDEVPEITSLTHLSDFVLAWMDTTGLKRCHILGYSMGGWITLSLALSYPHRFSRLILVATAAGLLTDVPLVSPDGMNFKEILEYFYYLPELKKKLIQQKLSLAEKKEIQRSSKAFARLSRKKQLMPNFHHRLSEITHPVLIISAEKDRAIPPAYQQHLHAGLSDATLRVFGETGHAVVAERPKALAMEILSFLQ